MISDVRDRINTHFLRRTINTMAWSTTEISVVRALTVQVRIATSDQIARGWFGESPDPANSAKTSLARLIGAGLVEENTVEAPIPRPLTAPVMQWEAGRPRPGFELFAAVADFGKRRAASTSELQVVYRASRRALRAFGSFAEDHPLRTCEIGHDLHLAEVLTFFRKQSPQIAEMWRGEGAFPKLGFEIKGMKDPDAFLIDASGRATRVVELVGSYKVDHLLAFHAHCSGEAATRLQRHKGLFHAFGYLYPQKGIGYELW